MNTPEFIFRVFNKTFKNTRMKTRVRFAKKPMVCAFMLAILFMGAISTGLGQSFSPNVRVNSADYDDLSLDGGAKAIAVVGNNVYTTWQGINGSSTGSIYFARSTDGGATFAQEINITESAPVSSMNFLPSLAIDPQGNPFITWTEYCIVQDSVFIGPRGFNGFIDEVRVWKDTALWTGDFTPPSAPHQVTGDPKLKLYLSMEDDNLTDGSLSSHSPQKNGNLVQSTTDSKFGNGSAYFDGDGTTYLSVPLNDDFNFGTDNFTIDYWVKFESLSTLDFVFADSINGSGTTGSIYGTGMNFYFYNPQSTICYYNNGSYIGNTYSTWFPTTDQWFHVAGVRHENTWMVFIDGVQVNTGYHDGSVESNYQAEAITKLARSVDGGVTFQEMSEVSSGNAEFFPSIAVFEDNIYIFYADPASYPMADYYFIRSTDGGNSFGDPLQINDQPCSASVEFDGVNSIAVDAAGNIYLVWVDGRRVNGQGDIFFSKSTDNGQSFSANVMVNDISQPGADSIQYLPSIAVENSNTLYVSFTDKRLGNDWTHHRSYLAKSTDGGSTFSSEALLADYDEICKHHDIAVTQTGTLYAVLCAHVMPHWGVWLFESTDGGFSFSNPVALCDTFNYSYSDVNIILDNNEDIFALWQDNRTGVENIYFAKTDLGTSVPATTFEKEVRLFPNPTSGSFTVELPDSDGNYELCISNLQGRIIYEKSVAGVSELKIDLPVPPGVYFVTVRSNDQNITLKLLNQQ